jgi:FMN-dependent NADH-azoreductase
MLGPLRPAAGKTFKYDAEGVQGLAGSKRVIIAVSRGGFYGADTPMAALEHLETDGIQVGPEHREKAVAGALQAAGSLHAA